MPPTSMTSDTQNNKTLAELLRRQLTNKILRRHLGALPLFRTDRWIPDDMKALLKKLDRKP